MLSMLRSEYIEGKKMRSIDGQLLLIYTYHNLAKIASTTHLPTPTNKLNEMNELSPQPSPLIIQSLIHHLTTVD